MTLICDFCSSPAIHWRYPAHTFRAAFGESVGDWCACDTCHNLIEADHRGALVVRSVDTLIATGTVPADSRAELLLFTKRLHDDFWDHRTGPAQEILTQ